MHAVSVLALVAGLGLGPVATGGLGDLLDNLLGGGGQSTQPDNPPDAGGEPTPAEVRRMGRVAAPDGVLGRGCSEHAWTYSVRPPAGSDNWSIEVFIKDADGRTVASSLLMSGQDGTSGRRTSGICRSGTRAGTFTITGRLTYTDYPHSYDGWLTGSRFTLRAPGLQWIAEPLDGRW